MKVFADIHHSGLFYSLHLLFEKRLGFEMYRPIGTEWFENGFWKIAEPYNNNPETVKQFLLLDSRYTPVDGTPPLNKEFTSAVTHWQIKDEIHGFIEKAITFEQFEAMDIDIIVASIPAHWNSFEVLRRRFKPKAKLICHMGNIFWETESFIKFGNVKNLMSSTIPFETKIPNKIFYHQEQPILPFEAIKSEKKFIRSFVHLLPKREQFLTYKKLLPEFQWEAYGADCPDGYTRTLQDLYHKMQESTWVYHVKPYGDGYGWNWHSAFMVGRPILTEFHDYHDKLGGLLFEDGVTGIDLDKGTVEENTARIRHYSEPEIHQKMCMQTRKRFEEIVQYEKEAQDMRRFIENLTE